MDKFIYVFSKELKDQLLHLNYHLMKEDEKNEIYVFENTEDIHLNFSSIAGEDGSFLFSNTLTF